MKINDENCGGVSSEMEKNALKREKYKCMSYGIAQQRPSCVQKMSKYCTGGNPTYE